MTAELKFAVENIETNFNSKFLPTCSLYYEYLTDTDLELKVDSQTKEITASALQKILGLGSKSKIAKAFVDPTYFDMDSTFINKFKIENSASLIAIKPADEYSEESSHTLQILAIIEEDSETFCRQAIRLFMSPGLELPDDWKVFSVLGRGGMDDIGFSLPYGTEFHAGNLWTTDCSNENISVFDVGGHFLGSFSSYGSELGKLDTPADMKIFDDHIYVVEEKNHRVQKFTLEGKVIASFGSFGKTTMPSEKLNKFNNPLGISVTQNQITVVDYENQRVVSFDHDFNPLWSSGNEVLDSFSWANPYYIDYSKHHDHFLVSNQSTSEIGILSPAGAKIRTFGSEVLETPFELAVTDNGDVIVADTTKYQAVWFDGQNDYKVKQVFKFPEYLGIPKTITSISQSKFAVGFVGNGAAYFLVFANTAENDSKSYTKNDKIEFIQHKSDGPLITTSFDVKNAYKQTCFSCHENGKYNAPARGNIEAWEAYPRDIRTLLLRTKQGVGAMIPNGGCQKCSEEEMIQLIEYMVPASWDENTSDNLK